MNVSVILSTYNRCDLLPGALESLIAQEPGNLQYEIVIVDNNSTDRTREVVERFCARDARVRYVFEGKQGLSHGRNAGIDAAQGSLLAFTDDDIRFPSDWIRQIVAAAERFPDADYFGGRVLPKWEIPLPNWADALMSPFALQDRGEQPLVIDQSNQVCLVGANLVSRAELIKRVGNFDPATQRVKDGVGSCEDYEWQTRIWGAGLHGVYVPELAVWTDVPADRLQKAYHRRWHYGHGSFTARMQRDDLVGSSFRLFDVPAYIYKQLMTGAASWLMRTLKGEGHRAFQTETHLFWNLGFLTTRWKAFFGGRRGQTPEPARTVPSQN